MFFASDNAAGVSPQISKALEANSTGFAASYGASDIDKAVEQTFNELFEREVAVFFVGTGTAANSLAFSAVNRPGGAVLCHREAHVIEDECGAPEFYTGGARLVPVDGQYGRINATALKRELARFVPGFVHHGQPMAVSLTQGTESGTVYQLDEIKEIKEIARTRDLPLHMDGARFANALVHLGVTPAEMTWKQGVDIVSFGGTKNGCWCAEALVFCNPEDAEPLAFMRKRAGHLFSKSRFIAAQFQAYFENDLWLENARTANNTALRLAEGIKASKKARLAWNPQINEVFPILKKTDIARLRDKGAVFHEWNIPHGEPDLVGEDEDLVRLVTSFVTENADVDHFIEVLGN